MAAAGSPGSRPPHRGARGADTPDRTLVSSAPVTTDARVQALREAVRIAPDDVELRRMLAAALLDDDPAASVDEYREVVRRAPDDQVAVMGLARAFQASGRLSAAIVVVDDLIARHGESGGALALRARLLAEEGHHDAAASAYRAAIRMDPAQVDVAFAARLGGALGSAATEHDHGPTPATDHDHGPAPATPPEAPFPGPRPDRAPDGTAPSAPGPDPHRRDVRRSGDAGDADHADEADRDDRERVPVIEEPADDDRSPVDVERPKITFDDVGGMESVKDEIRLKIIAPVEHAELYAAYGKSAGGGILLFGPPGCGKTYLARAAAGQMGRGFLSVGISDVLEMWLGQSERNLRDVFDGARAHRPCVLFFDEVDALAANRTDLRHSAGRNVVNQFLSELDGIEASNEGVLVLGATNAPWHLDPAFRRPGRFDRVIFVPPPDAAARAAILRIMLRGKPVADVDVEGVAARLELFSGADIKGLVDLAVERKLAEAMRDGIPTPIRTKDLLDAAKSTIPTTKEWLATARNHVLFANQSGLYDAVRPWLKL